MNLYKKEYFKTNTFLVIQFIFFSSVTFVLFFSNLSNYFLADDFWYLLKISKRSWFFAISQFYSHFDPLPVVLNKIIFTMWKFSPVPYRALLYLLHSLLCVVVFMVSVKLFELFSKDQDKNFVFIKSLLCSGIFSIMYIHTENILYINGHHEVLFSLFFLIALYFYLAYKQNGAIKNKLWLIIFFIFALCSKENTMVFLLLIISVEVFFFKTKLMSFFKNYYALPVISVGYLILRIILYDEQRLGLLYSTKISDIIIESIKNIFFTFTAFIFSLNFIQIKDIFREHQSNFIYSLDALIKLYPAAVLVIILTIAIYILIFIKRNKLINFGFLFIFITIVPFMWLAGYERYLYLPSFGFVLLAGETFGNLLKSDFYKYFAVILLSFFFIYNIYCIMEKKENYTKASEIALNGVNEIVRVSAVLPLNSDVYFRNLPDNYNGAWIFRDGVQYFPELYLNRIDLKFNKIYEDDIYTNEYQNVFVFNYDNGILKLEK